MKERSLVFVAMGLVAMVLAGCSATGTLAVRNTTSGDLSLTVSGQATTIATGTTGTHDFDLEYFPLFYNQSKSEAYTVEGLFKLAESRTATVTAQKTTTVTVAADAGAISIQNTSTVWSIVQVYISPSTDTTWGSNDLTGTIDPGHTHYFQVTPSVGSANYDVKIVDSYGDVGIIGVSAAHIHPSITADGLWQIVYDGYNLTWGTSLASVSGARGFVTEETQSTAKGGANRDAK